MTPLLLLAVDAYSFARVGLVIAACGAFIPGPCTFDPHRDFDCSLGDPCERNFACAADGFCKSADVACLDGETRCEYPDLARVAICVREEDFAASKTHCGTCFHTCRGAGTCVDGACTDEPAEGACLLARGNADCADGERCVDDGDNDPDTGTCEAGGDGADGAADGAGDAAPLDACSSDDDCASGLCKDEQCATTCDTGCAFGTHCDDDAIPGGLCVPDDGEVCR